MGLREIRLLVDECAVLRDYVDCLYWLLGIPDRPEWWNEFERFRGSMGQARDSKGLAHPKKWFQRLQSMRDHWQHIKSTFQDNVLCSDEELGRLAQEVKERGGVWLSKTEFDKRFHDFFEEPFWRFVPDYARIIVVRGQGVLLLSPEQDMFYLMCRSHDRAVLTSAELQKAGERVGKDWNPAYFELHANHYLEVRQVIVNACLFVEAFINSVAHGYRRKPPKPLSRNDDLYLQERVIDKKSGAEKEKHVALQDKLYRWVQIISPRGETFEKGAYPYQAFRKIQEYRDSIVHLSATKANRYHSISLSVATEAVDVALEMVEGICRFIAPNSKSVVSPNWLAKRETDGMFHLSSLIGRRPLHEAAGQPRGARLQSRFVE